jgi:MoxR-like ATPase
MSKQYPFDILNYAGDQPLQDTSILLNRPFTVTDNSFEADAQRFVPGDELEVAINTAIAVGEPLLITGEPGTGKTQAAYYAAYRLGIEPVLHFQVKSTSNASDLLYQFDAVRYFHDASVFRGDQTERNSRSAQGGLNKSDYVEKRDLWLAFESDTPRVLLIDEIDKAPRDFPNDLLLELDKMRFVVSETQEVISTKRIENRPIVFITSNSERRLPEPFLRRCVYHHIYFSEELLRCAVEKRREEYSNLSDDFIKLAMARFMALRNLQLSKLPSTSEFLLWLRVLSYHGKTEPSTMDWLLEQFKDNSSLIPFAGVLLKSQQDQEDAIGSNRFNSSTLRGEDS